MPRRLATEGVERKHESYTTLGKGSIIEDSYCWFILKQVNLTEGEGGGTVVFKTCTEFQGLIAAKAIPKVLLNLKASAKPTGEGECENVQSYQHEYLTTRRLRPVTLSTAVGQS